MKKNLVEIYALAVCFFTVIFLVPVAGMMAWNVVQFVAPEFTINNIKYEAHLTDQQYKDWLVQKNQYKKDQDFVPPSGMELTSARNTSVPTN